MLSDINFSNSFIFRNFKFTKNCKNDNRRGVKVHYLALMLSGSAKLVADDGTIEISEGDVFYIPNGKRYQSYWYGEPNISFISLGFGYMPSFDAQTFNTQLISAQDSERELFHKILARESINAESVGEFYTLLARLLPKMAPEKRSAAGELIHRTEKLIYDDPTLSVSALAKLLAVSESSLYAAFKQRSESSIGEIKRRVVMERAKDMLISTDVSVESVSEMLGFSSSSYFRKCFKSHFGKSPRQARKQYAI